MGNHIMNGVPREIIEVFMLLKGIAGFILSLILLYLAYRFMKKNEGEFIQKSETPLERLKMRLVKGEITKEEYEELKKIIEN